MIYYKHTFFKKFLSIAIITALLFISTQNTADAKTINIKKFYGYKLPLEYRINHKVDSKGKSTFSIAKKGNYYYIKGTLDYPECVYYDVITKAKKNQKIKTIAGKSYVVLKVKNYNNDQRTKVILKGNDGRKYEVTNLPAFNFYEYYNTTYCYIYRKGSSKIIWNTYKNVKVKAHKSTKFGYPGNKEKTTIGSWYDKDAFSSYSEGLAFYIGFSKKGKIDVFVSYDLPG